MVNAKLDLFKTPLTDISTSSYRMVPIQPFTTVTTPIDFQVDAQGDFVDLNRNYFDVELQLSSTDNNNLARTADDTDTMIAPVNNFAHSIFKQINMRLNGTLISEQTDTYYYKTYMETPLNNNRQDGETILVPQGWYNHIDVVSQYTAANIKNDGAQRAALSQQNKDTLKAQKDALVPFVAQRRHTLRMKPHRSFEKFCPTGFGFQNHRKCQSHSTRKQCGCDDFTSQQYCTHPLQANQFQSQWHPTHRTSRHVPS